MKETLAAQSADIDMVSGATYTSDGYLSSLQS
ncbi:FMN-binding protein, partial [Vibrio parahaemolyticus]